MSSVFRGPAQTPSRYLWSEDGPYLHTFAQMQSAFATYNPVYDGNVILFANGADLGSAISAIESAADGANRYADSHVSLLDFGKKIFLGVAGGDSRIFTYNLIRVCKGSYNDGAAYFVLTNVGPIDNDIRSTLGNYGEVWVGRAA